MSRRLVWTATLALVASLAAGAASAQYRGYGYDYGAAPDYYGGGPFSGPYGGEPAGRGPYADPGDMPPPRGRNQQSYDDPREAGPQGYEPRGYGPRGGDPYGYGDPRGDSRADYDYDRGPGQPTYVEPYNGGRDPDHKASDVDLKEGSSQTTKTEVDNPTRQAPGTIVINTAERHLYFVEPGGKAIQYGIGVGREGFAWKGTAHVERKQEWPDWIPPSDMIKRRPDLPERMAGGIENPLGARAMYLFQGKKDTMFRIHGTNEPDSIGKAMSSGCIRMMNYDVIDLYSRVPVGAKVVVM